MKRIIFGICMMLAALTTSAEFKNPMLFADVPDHDIILIADFDYFRVGQNMSK